MFRLRTLLPLAPLLVLLAAVPAPAWQKPAAPRPPNPPKPGTVPRPVGPSAAQEPQLRDRVLAVVDEDPILQSDLDRVVALGLAQSKPGEDPTVFRRRVLDQLIEERLRFHEMDRFGFEQVPVEDVDAHVAEIRARFKDDAALQKALKEQGMTLKDLRQLVARQLMVLAYVDEQLGPRVFVSLDDINNYYRTVLTPQMQKQGQQVPPVEDVRDQIRAVLREQRLNEAIGKWTEELRRKADVQVYFDQPAGKLPPVVKKITTPPAPSKPA
ncbi:MAG TPA: SurA N-terminal domain-containing protein [Thermoanaerobaculia bacterium]|nr:SurA N-terminal domain-containing protein [Thermoanaerobaculia bacterium]